MLVVLLLGDFKLIFCFLEFLVDQLVVDFQFLLNLALHLVKLLVVVRLDCFGLDFLLVMADLVEILGVSRVFMFLDELIEIEHLVHLLLNLGVFSFDFLLKMTELGLQHFDLLLMLVVKVDVVVKVLLHLLILVVLIHILSI